MIVMIFPLLVTVFLRVSDSYALTEHASFKTEQCVGCHPRANPTHSMAESKDIPEGWPVGLDGKIICISCHDCKSGRCYLGISTTPELCGACHDCTQGMACLIGTAHIGNMPPGKLSSQYCISCHDGMISKSVRLEGHKVDMRYIPKAREFNVVTDRKDRLCGRQGKLCLLS